MLGRLGKSGLGMPAIACAARAAASSVATAMAPCGVAAAVRATAPSITGIAWSAPGFDVSGLPESSPASDLPIRSNRDAFSPAVLFTGLGSARTGGLGLGVGVGVGKGTGTGAGRRDGSTGLITADFNRSASSASWRSCSARSSRSRWRVRSSFSRAFSSASRRSRSSSAAFARRLRSRRISSRWRFCASVRVNPIGGNPASGSSGSSLYPITVPQPVRSTGRIGQTSHHQYGLVPLDRHLSLQESRESAPVSKQPLAYLEANP